jgi:hypothetical protein
MNGYELLTIVFGCGATGGLINCTHFNRFQLPHTEERKHEWRPGWLRHIVVGGFAAVCMWGLYGPDASFDIGSARPLAGHLTIFQCVMSFLVGFGGGQFLTSEVQKRILKQENEGEKSAKATVIDVAKKLLDEEKDNDHGK